MTTGAAHHPTFDAAPKEKRWASPLLAGLFDSLRLEAEFRPTSLADEVLDTGWSWRIMEDGLVVGLRTLGKPQYGLHRLELRLAADGALAGGKPFDERVGEVTRGFQLRIADGRRCPFTGALWVRAVPVARDEGKQVVRFVSLLTGETAPPPRRTP